MSYSLNRGIEDEGLDNTQRGLLIGLPAIALILSFGAVHKHNINNPVTSPNTIPVVSTLKFGDGSSDNTGSAGNTGSNPQAAASASSAASAPAYTSPTSAATSPISSGTSSGTTGVIGGMGGGPTGGGGGVSLPDCSIGQIATVNCVVPACSPPVTLAPGQKAILGLDGTCIVVN